MPMPYLRPNNRSRQQQIISFGGVNYSEAYSDGELQDCKNLTTDLFPRLSPRRGRQAERTYTEPHGLYYHNGKTFAVDGNRLLLDGEAIGNVTPGDKRFVTVNTQVVILPDRIIYNTETGKLFPMGAKFESGANLAEFKNKNTLVVNLGNFRFEKTSSGNKGGKSKSAASIREDRVPFDAVLASLSINAQTGEITKGKETAKTAEDVRIGDWFYDAGLGIDGATRFGKITKRYVSPLTPVPAGGSPTGEKQKYGFDYDILEKKGEAQAVGSFEEMGFKVGDTIHLEGCTTYPGNNRALTIRGFGTEGENPTLTTIIFDRDAFEADGPEAGAITIERKAPELDMACESQNRLWGTVGNEIHASALGDPTNWETFDGLSTDSWAVNVATDGAFTGCIGFDRGVCFFKEDVMHKVLGDFPAQYNLYDYVMPGVKAGSEKSLVNINETLFYHGRDGVYRFISGQPQRITANFGQRRFRDARAGSTDGKYYISMREGNLWGMWVYDTRTGIWLQEDDTEAVCFAFENGRLHYIDRNTKTQMQVNPEISAENVEWSATLCPMNEVTHDRKYYPRLNIRLEVSEGATFKVEVSQDGGDWRQVYSQTGRTPQTIIIPILLPRCDEIRIRMSGTGRCKVESLLRHYQIGSELN